MIPSLKGLIPNTNLVLVIPIRDLSDIEKYWGIEYHLLYIIYKKHDETILS